MSDSSSQQGSERGLLFLLRVAIGWIFLWAAIHHYGDSSYVAGFLSHTKTFNPIYAPIVTSSFLPLISFCVEYGHLLIGLSLISGLLVRVSGPFAILLMLLYWTAHLDFPYVDTINNFLVDEHIIAALGVGLLMVRRAGHAWGMDGVLAQSKLAQDYSMVRQLTA